MNVEPMNYYFAQHIDFWKRTGKKKYEIWATIAQPGVTVKNKLELSEYTTDLNKCVVLSGTAGEQWTVTLKKLAETYMFATGESIKLSSITRHMKHSTDGWMKVATIPGQLVNYAMFLDINQFRNVPISTSWGERLFANRDGIEHGAGDFLVCGMNPDGSPNFNDMWVVNGKIFLSTYNLQGFNLSSKARQLSALKAPRPGKLNIYPSNFANNCINFLRQYEEKVTDVDLWKGVSLTNRLNVEIFYIRANTEDHVVIKQTEGYPYYYIIFKDLTYGYVERPNVGAPYGDVGYLPERLSVNSKEDLINQLKAWGAYR